MTCWPIVVAETRQQARAAALLVDVAYDVLAPVTDPLAAVEPGAEVAVWGTDDNVLSRSVYARGDVDAALAASAHTIHEVFQTQRIEHAFLEPESTLAVPSGAGDDRTMHVYSGGQGVWDDRDDICRMLALPTDRVTVELVSNGGAFGGKEDMSNQAHASLAAWLLDRPVKCTLSREESFRMHAKRHPIRLEYWAGCDADGVLTRGQGARQRRLRRLRVGRDEGARTGRRPRHRPVPRARTSTWRPSPRAPTTSCAARSAASAPTRRSSPWTACSTASPSSSASAGWEIRKRNVIRPGAVWGPGQIMDDGAGGAEACLDAIKPAYDAAARRRQGGRARARAEELRARQRLPRGVGGRRALREHADLEVRRACELGERARVEVRHGWTEMGQGVHTVALQVAAEELAIDPARIDVIVDTTRQLGFGQTTGSRGTLMAAGAVQRACQAALAADCAPDVDHCGEHVVDWTSKLGDPANPNPTIHAAFGYAAQLAVVDRESGKVERVVAVHDVGKAVNPQLCAGQIEGSVHMGLGYALTEDFPTDPETGFPTFSTLRQLGILRAKDVPAIEVELVEVPQPQVAVRHQGRRRDRPRADGPGRRRRAARPRRRVAHDAPDEARLTRPSDEQEGRPPEGSVVEGRRSLLPRCSGRRLRRSAHDATASSTYTIDNTIGTQRWAASVTGMRTAATSAATRKKAARRSISRTPPRRRRSTWR